MNTTAFDRLRKLLPVSLQFEIALLEAAPHEVKEEDANDLFARLTGYARENREVLEALLDWNTELTERLKP
jgi:hypothetical protein